VDSAVPTVRVPDHLRRTAVVFDELRLFYAPVPKAGSTSILWALAEVVGLRPEDFALSQKLEVTRALTIHDASIWGAEHRLEGRSDEETEKILGSDEWFRVTVVREPVRRLWSSWASKVLVRDPRVAAVFGDAEPPPISSAQDVVEAFRAFVCALPSRVDWHDRHWSSQAELIGVGDVTYAHVGRLEDFDRTIAALAEHVAARGVTLPPLQRKNPSILPFTSGVYGGEARAACDAWTARDREAFGYEPPWNGTDEPADAWYATVDATIPAIQAIVERNDRIADLRTMLTDGSGEAVLEATRGRIRALGARLRRGTVGGSDAS
jgi:hypothetical protein